MKNCCFINHQELRITMTKVKNMKKTSVKKCGVLTFLYSTDENIHWTANLEIIGF